MDIKGSSNVGRQAARLATLLVLPCCAALADPGDNPVLWLERMANASRTLDYQGTFVYERGDQAQTLRVVHQANESGERERLITLDGPSREVVRDGRRVTCVLPEEGSVIIEKGAAAGGLPLKLPEKLDGIARHYRIDTGATTRIADREARHVRLHPGDTFRYGHEFWVDVEHGLLLKSELVDVGGEVLERVLFTSVEVFEQLPDELLQPAAIEGEVIHYHEGAAVAAIDNPAWSVRELPDGFHLTSHRRHQRPSTGQEMEHLLFTDGLASVSVFIEPHEAEGAVEGPFLGSDRSGSISAFARVIDRHRITVIGEVPPTTTELIGLSVVHGGGR